MKPARLRTPTWDRVWIGADLATMDEAEGHRAVPDAALAIRDGRIAWVGTLQLLSRSVVRDDRDRCARSVDHAGTDRMPHAPGVRRAIAAMSSRHVCAARPTKTSHAPAAESCRRCAPHDAASEDELLAQSLPRAAVAGKRGRDDARGEVGVRARSCERKLKMLRVAQRIGEQLGIDVVKTFLGAHALPPEFANRRTTTCVTCATTCCPQSPPERLADAVDVFCERIAFTREQTRSSIRTRAGVSVCALRLHADQLSDGGGGEIAARYGALSADHLEYASDASLKAMAARGVVAGLLPGAFYFLREKQAAADRADARARRRRWRCRRIAIRARRRSHRSCWR